MTTVLWLVVGIAFACGGLVLGGGPWLYRYLKRKRYIRLVKVYPSTGRVEHTWVSPPERDYVEVGEADVALDEGYVYQGEHGTEFLVDMGGGKPMRVEPESHPDDASPVERLNGYVLNKIRQDERMRQWHAYQSSGLETLAKYALPALTIIGLTVVAILVTVLQGFGYMGK